MIPDYGYRCVLTNPQIELMAADLPHVLYESPANGAVRPDDPSIRLNEESLRRREERLRWRAGEQTGGARSAADGGRFAGPAGGAETGDGAENGGGAVNGGGAENGGSPFGPYPGIAKQEARPAAAREFAGGGSRESTRAGGRSGNPENGDGARAGCTAEEATDVPELRRRASEQCRRIGAGPDGVCAEEEFPIGELFREPVQPDVTKGSQPRQDAQNTQTLWQDQ